MEAIFFSARPHFWVAFALTFILCWGLTGCGGGSSPDEVRRDDGSLSYKKWLWEFEGGDPKKFSLPAFCKIQPEHC